MLEFLYPWSKDDLGVNCSVWDKEVRTKNEGSVKRVDIKIKFFILGLTSSI